MTAAAPASVYEPTAAATATQATTTGVKLTAHNQYDASRLDRAALPADPLDLFRAWLAEALRPAPGSPFPPVREPEAMVLSTATARGVPSSRVVLLKEVDGEGFVFFTNYNSRKSAELEANPYAALAFHWREVSRQVRAVGKVAKVSREESEAYFATRPRGSQLGAWASAQSSAVGEGALAAAVEEATKKFEGKDVPCPEHWGGWRLVPFEIEFWAGQPSRLHDRFRYTRPEAGGEWAIDRLAP
ncbi:pyridoxamine-phosphate oxidase [Vanrija albida]|uniref:pyridoxal 5'-phosphate synthase n=1 Tax=Vanrija albida TaxID=181172 RepID=A0ABR3Q5V8_9TREE